MAVSHVVAHAPSLGDWMGLGLTPRFELGQNSIPVLETRQNSNSSAPTVNMFIDGLDESNEYAASIVTACADQTVYALQCISPRSTSLGVAVCGPNAAVGTVTVNPSKYDFSSATATTTLGVTVQATVIETCTLAGTTAATCAATIKASAQGTSTTVSSTTTLAGSSYYRYDVAITGGAEKTAAATGKCTSAAAGLDGKSMVIWALAAGAGVSGLLAMM